MFTARACSRVLIYTIPHPCLWAVNRGEVTALKPVRAEQVRRPSESRIGLCHTVDLFCLYA